MPNQSEEKKRLNESQENKKHWKKWGPYLSERQWGTVREDYSEGGDAWGHFSHDQARSRTYRWGEDGLGGICDDQQNVCFALALWNGKDPILKERLFGLTNAEGNHGEDVKEQYFYLDSTPTHSYMKFLYKYPQNEFPYEKLVNENKNRTKLDREYELLDTGVFDDIEYFDVFIEYIKQDAEDIFIKISAKNKNNKAADLHLLPTIWFRNTWQPKNEKASVNISKENNQCLKVESKNTPYFLYINEAHTSVFTNNETNNERIFNSKNHSKYVKDGINNHVVNGKTNEINPNQNGTKASFHIKKNIAANDQEVIYLHLTNKQQPEENIFENIEALIQKRIYEANAFYKDIFPDNIKENTEEYRIMRQALAGMLWSKQYFNYDVGQWLKEHNLTPLTKELEKAHIRNKEWHHMDTNDIISMPDKWEYPWFAAWDLAFHIFPLRLVDHDFAKDQLDLMLKSDYMHPNGQIPAYEWNFSDVNPPVHAWATIQTYLSDKAQNKGEGDLEFLQYNFEKLLLNFMWWVNRKDIDGNNLFQGGFLGLDNIGVFDRSADLPTGGHIEQADGTAWMAFFSMQMLRMSIELLQVNDLYASHVYKFFTHATWISSAMNHIGNNDEVLWDEEDGFFYDLLHFPDGSTSRLKVRSLVGLLPIISTCVFPDKTLEKYPELISKMQGFAEKYSDAMAELHTPEKRGVKNRAMISMVNEDKLRKLLAKMLDEKEFLSNYGIRSLSYHHKENPYIFNWNNEEFKVEYLAGESDNNMFGGNSNWRGPVWIPMNFLLINSLLNYYSYYGEEFTIECPTGSGNHMTLLEVSKFISKRLIKLFLPDGEGKRPTHGNDTIFADYENWKDLILFYEYFNGETGEGLGASHQTGWTGCITEIIRLVNIVTPENFHEVALFK